MAIPLMEVKQLEPGVSPDPIPPRVDFEQPTVSITSLAPVLPTDMLVGALRDPRLRLHSPLHVLFRREDDFIIAECKELDEFGYGRHLTEAIEDLQQVVAELYFTLKTEEGRLGSYLRQ